MKTSKYPFKVKKDFCRYSVEFFEKKYTIYKSDFYVKKTWVIEEIGGKFIWFGFKKLSDCLDMLMLIYGQNIVTFKDLTARLLESLKLEGGDKK